ncbi:Cytochrome c oxidase assembly protein cox19 [Neofusicoccum ribis]|uniref:Cytochrome c oxidase assembly protein cox19 n=1 Tax=Neofusicoccum ribis TaxID=45134 RepID=A0ABR3T5E8_9PEZI
MSTFGSPGGRTQVQKPIPNLMAPDEMKNLGFHEASNDASGKPTPTPEPQSKGASAQQQ